MTKPKVLEFLNISKRIFFNCYRTHFNKIVQTFKLEKIKKINSAFQQYKIENIKSIIIFDLKAYFEKVYNFEWYLARYADVEHKDYNSNERNDGKAD